MEKEIYLTQTPYYSAQSNENNTANRQKANIIPQPCRTALKENNNKFIDNLPLQSYYDDKKVKPGITFYKAILDIEQLRANGQYNGPLLNITIPETVLLNDNSNSMIYTENGTVKVQSFVNNEGFLAKLELDKYQNSIFPLVIHSSITGITFSNSIMMSNEIIGNKIIPRSQGFICRRFVRPYADTPNVLRVYFTPQSQGSIKKNYAYKMVNRYVMDEDMFRKKHRHTHNYLVNPQRQQSFSITLIKGKSLQICQTMAQSLTQYLQKGLGLRISDLVLDFVIDDEKVPWLLQVKSIKSKILTKLWDIGNSDQIRLITDKNNNSQQCRLCGMMYGKPQLVKLVTNKLIWQLIQHIQARGIPFQSIPHLKKQGFSYVCDVCYELIVAEHKLVDVEKEFSGLLNITASTTERVLLPNKTGGKPRFLQEEDFQADGKQGPKLKAWRLFFYLQRIKNYEKKDNRKPNKINLEMSFKTFKQTFTKILPIDLQEQSKITKSRYSMLSRAHSAKLSKKSILLQKFAQSTITRQSQCGDGSRDYGKNNKGLSRLQKGQKIVETATTMVSKVSTSQVHTKQVISIEKVKVFVLYTKKHQSNNIFANTEMQFHLNIDDQNFDGRSFTLQQLKNKDTCQRHSSEIFLFNQALKYCNLQLTVGLICDGEVELDQLGLQETDGIFYHKKALSMCRPLPDEWMEVFTQGEEIPSHSKELNYEQIRSSYVNRQKLIRERLQKITTK